MASFHNLLDQILNGLKELGSGGAVPLFKAIFNPLL
jgi:hypothetical protein